MERIGYNGPDIIVSNNYSIPCLGNYIINAVKLGTMENQAEYKKKINTTEKGRRWFTEEEMIKFAKDHKAGEYPATKKGVDKFIGDENVRKSKIYGK